MAESETSYFICHLTGAQHVCLCSYPTRLNKALIRLVHRDPIVNDVIPRLTNIQLLTLIYASSGYQSLNLETISYLATIQCQFGRYRYTKLPFNAASARNISQKK